MTCRVATHRLLQAHGDHTRRVLMVLEPVATKVRDLPLKMGKHSPITCVLGIPPYKADFILVSQKPPVEAQVIIGTPITFHKWIVAKMLVLDDIKMLLIDGVDRVLAEVIMCSTISNDVVEAFVSKTKQVLRTMEVPSLDNVKHYKVNVPNEISKINIIQNKILDHNPKVGQTIIYHTKESVGMLCGALEVNKFKLKTIDAEIKSLRSLKRSGFKL
ncbi:hypothetical protein Tco_0450724 [Tanacetum coccineum]